VLVMWLHKRVGNKHQKSMRLTSDMHMTEYVHIRRAPQWKFRLMDIFANINATQQNLAPTFVQDHVGIFLPFSSS
jgi:hypothetical protein